MKKSLAYIFGAEIVGFFYHFDVFLLFHDLVRHVLLFLFENHLGHLFESHSADDHYFADNNCFQILDLDTSHSGVTYHHICILSQT